MQRKFLEEGESIKSLRSKTELMNTIILPNNLKQLKDKLPCSNYNINSSFEKFDISSKENIKMTRVNSANNLVGLEYNLK